MQLKLIEFNKKFLIFFFMEISHILVKIEVMVMIHMQLQNAKSVY